jgi:hypothetical protein
MGPFCTLHVALYFNAKSMGTEGNATVSFDKDLLPFSDSQSSNFIMSAHANMQFPLNVNGRVIETDIPIEQPYVRLSVHRNALPGGTPPSTHFTIYVMGLGC